MRIALTSFDVMIVIVDTDGRFGYPFFLFGVPSMAIRDGLLVRILVLVVMV